MERTIEIIKEKTGLGMNTPEATTLKNGRKAFRASIALGNQNLSILLIPLPKFDDLAVIKDIVQLAEFERIILHIESLNRKQMQFLKSKGVGYIDENENFYIPLELVSNTQLLAPKKEPERAPSTSNEFKLGFLFLKNYGLLDQTQADLAKVIGKSATTVNFALKKMEHENLIVKTDKGYHLANIASYFDRWRYIVAEYKAKKRLGKKYRGKRKEKPDDIRDMHDGENKDHIKYSLSGPLADSWSMDGYIRNAEGLSIFVESKTAFDAIKRLELIPDENGPISIYSCTMSLKGEGILAHEALIAAELLNSSHPRVKEAGEVRLEHYLEKANKVMHERFGRKYF